MDKQGEPETFLLPKAFGPRFTVQGLCIGLVCSWGHGGKQAKNLEDGQNSAGPGQAVLLEERQETS